MPSMYGLDRVYYRMNSLTNSLTTKTRGVLQEKGISAACICGVLLFKLWVNPFEAVGEKVCLAVVCAGDWEDIGFPNCFRPVA